MIFNFAWPETRKFGADNGVFVYFSSNKMLREFCNPREHLCNHIAFVITDKAGIFILFSTNSLRHLNQQ